MCKTAVCRVCIISLALQFLAIEGHTSQSRFFEIGIAKINEYNIDESKVIENRDLSGIACISDSHCVIASDETRCVQFFAISRENRTIEIHSQRYSADLPPGTIDLLPASVGSEIDIEAVTAIGNAFYVMGSHGVAKKSGLLMEPRYTCFRFKVDPITGKLMDGIDQSTLKHVLKNDPVLGKYYGKVLQQRGINIEGMAARDGKLFIGLRAPNINGNAHIIEIDPDELFKTKIDKIYKLHAIPLGKASGIREMVAIKSGFLIADGNSGSEAGNSENPDTINNIKDYNQDRGYYLYFWDGKKVVEKIAEILRAKDKYKVEAMTVLGETDQTVQLLILYDGPKGGKPTVCQIRKVIK